MKMKFNKYFRPTSVQEAIELLQNNEDSKIVAGGTDVVIRLRAHMLKVDTLIDISAIPELKEIKVEGDNLVIGSTYDLMSLSKDPIVKDGKWEIIAECAGHVSSTQVRNRATLGGNNVNASPSADTTPALLISDATVNVVGPDGKRDIPIDEFLLGPGKTALGKNEIVVSFTIPKPDDRCEAAYHKHAIRGDTDIAIVGVGVRIGLNEDNTIKLARVALGAVAPRSIRVKEVEEFLIGKKVTDDVVEEAAKMASEIIHPITDQRATAEYRKEMVYVAMKHMIKDAAAKIK